MVAAAAGDRLDEPCVFNGPVNGEAFTANVEQALAPTLTPGDMVIVYNLGSQMGQAVRSARRRRT